MKEIEDEIDKYKANYNIQVLFYYFGHGHMMELESHLPGDDAKTKEEKLGYFSVHMVHPKFTEEN